MSAKLLMIQGTASSVGKSIMVTGLCRILRQDGFKVAPFKSQNMALNSYVTRDGGEIGRAQAVQAEAAGIEASIYMNPVLLKPETDHRCQVVVLGKVAQTLPAADYYRRTRSLMKIVEQSLERLRDEFEIVVIEGAGSPAEVNFRTKEIANMRVARRFNAPVLLVGDIDRGGVFGALLGTLQWLTPAEKALVKGLVINKFRGDRNLLESGIKLLERRTRRPVLGVVPFIPDVAIAQEDSVFLDERPKTSFGADLMVAIVRFPHTSNYDDFDPLEAAGCSVKYVANSSELGSPDLIVLPGTKTTISDLDYLKRTGMAAVIVRKAREGTPVLGICGGFQMLGRVIVDHHHVESGETVSSGLGLLNVETLFGDVKRTVRVKARVENDRGLLAGLKGCIVTGYEIHMGQTRATESDAAFRVIETPEGRADYVDGAVSENGWVVGSYLHGLFHNSGFTHDFLNELRTYRGLPARLAGPSVGRDQEYNTLAQVIREHVEMDRIYRIIGVDSNSDRKSQ